MLRKLPTLILVIIVAFAFVPVHSPAKAQHALKIGFVAGVSDPFYANMERGVKQAASDLGAELVTLTPTEWNSTVQIPLLQAMIAHDAPDYIIIAPVHKEELIAPLQTAADAGIKIITVDTFLGDGDYANGPITFPLSYIGSDNVEGGRIAGRTLAERLGETGSVYIQNTYPGTSTTEQRSQGFREAIGQFPNMTIVGEDYNLDDAATSIEQTTAVLQNYPDVKGIFGVNVFSAQGAGTAVMNAGLEGEVEVIAFDATQSAITQLRDGVVSMVIAQKPYDMGYLAVEFAKADWRGVSSLPKRVPTGYAVITIDNVDDPEIARFIYQ